MSKEALIEKITLWVSVWTNLNVEPHQDLFIDLGLDSLHYAELISKIEATFGLELDFSSLLDWESVRTISGISDFVFGVFQKKIQG